MPVTLEQLQAVAALLPPEPTPIRKTVPRGTAPGPFDMEGFILKHGLVTRTPVTYRGGQKWQMDCLFNPAHKAPDACLYVTAAGAAAYECSHNSCKGNDWYAVRDLLEPGWKEERAKQQEEFQERRSRYQRRKELEKKRETIGERVKTLDDLPVIETNDRHLREVSAAAVKALVDANDPPIIFVRSGKLVRLVRDENGVPTISMYTGETLRYRAARVANFVSTSDDRGTVPVAPPANVITDILASPSFDEFPPLESVATSPVVAEDGTLVIEPGYIEPARVYYHETDERLEALAASGRLWNGTEPTPQNVASAKDLLLTTLLGDFPYVDQSSRTHALCALLQPFVRPCIGGNTPLYLIDAPTQGTGKSLLAETICAVFMGRVPASTPCPERRGEEEWRKLLTTAFLEGPTHVWFDNLKYKLESAVLAQALTSQQWTDRLLSLNQSATCPVRCTWLLTANNIELDGDFPRRSVWIRLDTKQERPEDRDPNSFAISDLQRFVQDERPQLIRAVLTLLRAWIKAGRPAWSGQPIGSYVQWCRVMGGLLESIGVEGFLENRELLYAKADPERERWFNFVGLWWETHKDKPVTAGDLIEIAAKCEIVSDAEARGTKNQWGRLLRAREEQVITGFAITKAGTRDRAATYRLIPAAKTGKLPFDGPPRMNKPERNESIPPTYAESGNGDSTRVGVFDSSDSSSFIPIEKEEKEEDEEDVTGLLRWARKEAQAGVMPETVSEPIALPGSETTTEPRRMILEAYGICKQLATESPDESWRESPLGKANYAIWLAIARWWDDLAPAEEDDDSTESDSVPEEALADARLIRGTTELAGVPALQISVKIGSLQVDAFGRTESEALADLYDTIAGGPYDPDERKLLKVAANRLLNKSSESPEAS